MVAVLTPSPSCRPWWDDKSGNLTVEQPTRYFLEEGSIPVLIE